MGAYASNFRRDSGSLVSENSHPSQGDWITAHAEATDLSVLEVERLWSRFRQMGCNEDGFLSENAMTRPELTDNIFMKNILGTFRSESDGSISFQTFCNAMQWAQTERQEQKVRAVFHLLNNGNPVEHGLLVRILKRTYPDESQEAVERIADVFMEQMDLDKKDGISEKEFIRWIKMMPAETIGSILEFSVIPPELKPQEENQLSPQPSPVRGEDIPSEDVLRKVAERAARRDWHMLANQLDFTGQEMRSFEDQFPRSMKHQILGMLKAWREREGENATKAVLEGALKRANMKEISVLLKT